MSTARYLQRRLPRDHVAACSPCSMNSTPPRWPRSGKLTVPFIRRVRA
jgi:hypothetical protein